MRPYRGFFLSIAVAATAAFLIFADAPTSATSPALHEQTFVDEATGMSLRVQLDTAAADAGHWTVRVNGGVYSGDAGSGLRINALTSAILSYDGPAVLRPTAGPAVSRSIRLQAQIDAAHHTAEAKLWDGASQFHIVAKAADVTGLDTTLVSLEDAISSNDATKMYALANAQVTQTYDAAAFAAVWASQSAAGGRVTALRRISVGAPLANDQGFWYVAVEYSADVVTPAGPGVGSFTAFFIHEPRGWKLWTTKRH